MPGKNSDRWMAAAAVLARGGSLKAAAAAFTFPSMMAHSGSKGWVSLAPRNFPWAQTDLLGNSIVSQCLAWATRNFPQAVFQVVQERRDGTEKPIDGHPLTELIYAPNSGYGAEALWCGTLASYFLDGNAYWIKVRNARGLGVPSAIWYAPHWMIEPAWAQDGSEFISHYEYRINGKIIKLMPSDVVHFRYGLDPNNTRKGRSPLRAILREAFTDDEAGYFAAALLKNMAIPGVIVAPAESIGMNQTKAESIKESWKRKFGGDNRGEPLILDFQASIDTIGFSPNDLNFEVLRRVPEERISGAFGIPAIVAGLGVGLDSSTYNNLANLKKSAFEECLIPTWVTFADTLAKQLLPDLTTRADEWCRFDAANIRALQENEDARHKRVREDYRQGLISFNESRSALGLPPNPTGDFFVIPNNARLATPETMQALANAQPATPATSPADLPAPGAEPKRLPAPEKKTVEFDGLICSREPTPLEIQIGLKSIAEAMATSQQTITAQALAIRVRLIESAAAELARMGPDQWPGLTLTVTEAEQKALRAAVVLVFNRGRALIDQELARQAGAKGWTGSKDEALPDPPPTIIDRLVSMAVAYIVNAVQSVAVEIASRLGLVAAPDTPDFTARLRQEIGDTSTTKIETVAAETSNATLAQGRATQIEWRKAAIERVIYSSVLDTNTCGPCEAADGQEGAEADITPAPNPSCEGKARCRCIHVAVLAGEK